MSTAARTAYAGVAGTSGACGVEVIVTGGLTRSLTRFGSDAALTSINIEVAAGFVVLTIWAHAFSEWH